MKLIFRIARTELATLFYSPIAWLILIVFSVQVGNDFMNILNDILRVKFLKGDITFSIAAGLVLGSGGLYEVIQTSLYLYIPLLTMNLMSREYASGSIKLLYSSPLTSTHIILGKFLSMVIYCLLLTLILFIPLGIMMFYVPNLDMSLIFSGLLGLFMLLLTYCAIGLFMSTITSYQVVAAVATLSALAFLNYIGMVGQQYAFVREITYWLSLSGRASELVGGLICSDDIIYFITVILLFLSFAVIKIHQEKCRYSLPMKFGQYAGALLVVVSIGFISSRPAVMGFVDATRVKQRTLTLQSQEVMKQLKGGLTITTYLNIFDDLFKIGAPENIKKDQERFKMYTRFKPEIELEYVYYYSRPTDTSLLNAYPGKTIDEIAADLANKKGVSFKRLKKLEDIDPTINLAAENYSFFRLIERESGERSILRIYNDMFQHPNESEISAALKKLVVEPVKVGFVTGHGERNPHRKGDRDYSIFSSNRTMRSSMINQGFDVAELNLSTIDDVPSEINILLIADMREQMSEAEDAVLERFIARGGNLIILTDINRQQSMNPLLSKFGVEAQNGILVQPADIYLPNLALTRGTDEGAEIVGGIYRRFKQYANNTITMQGAVALKETESKGFNITPLLKTGENSWIEYETTDFINDSLRYNPTIGEQTGSYTTAMALTRKIDDKEQRVLIFGDADYISNSELMLSDRAGFNAVNFSTIPANFRWLCYGEFPVVGTRAANSDIVINMTPIQIPTVKTIVLYVIPLLFAAIGILIWLRRRKG